jgi:hypothetical protein
MAGGQQTVVGLPLRLDLIWYVFGYVVELVFILLYFV